MHFAFFILYLSRHIYLAATLMEYHIRPVDNKHRVILPVGHGGEFKLKKDRLFLIEKRELIRSFP
jgi:hypothetical protein